MHALRGPDLQREPGRERAPAGLRAGLPDPRPALRRPRRSGVGCIEAGRRSRRRGADAGAGIRAGQPLSSTTSAARWRRRQRGGRGERHGYESRVATALAGAVVAAVGAKVQLRNDLTDRHSRKSGNDDQEQKQKQQRAARITNHTRTDFISRRTLSTINTALSVTFLPPPPGADSGQTG